MNFEEVNLVSIINMISSDVSRKNRGGVLSTGLWHTGQGSVLQLLTHLPQTRQKDQTQNTSRDLELLKLDRLQGCGEVTLPVSPADRAHHAAFCYVHMSTHQE